MHRNSRLTTTDAHILDARRLKLMSFRLLPEWHSFSGKLFLALSLCLSLPLSLTLSRIKQTHVHKHAHADTRR